MHTPDLIGRALHNPYIKSLLFPCLATVVEKLPPCAHWNKILVGALVIHSLPYINGQLGRSGEEKAVHRPAGAGRAHGIRNQATIIRFWCLSLCTLYPLMDLNCDCCPNGNTTAKIAGYATCGCMKACVFACVYVWRRSVCLPSVLPLVQCGYWGQLDASTHLNSGTAALPSNTHLQNHERSTSSAA